jgi:hypothetical protein
MVSKTGNFSGGILKQNLKGENFNGGRRVSTRFQRRFAQISSAYFAMFG